MAYCPKCQAEYAEGVKECIDCRVRLRPGHRPIRVGPDLEDVLVPVGSLACLLIATGLLLVWYAAREGRLGSASATILSTQPTCLVAFYAVAAVLSAITFAAWLVQRLAQGGRR